MKAIPLALILLTVTACDRTPEPEPVAPEPPPVEPEEEPEILLEDLVFQAILKAEQGAPAAAMAATEEILLDNPGEDLPWLVLERQSLHGEEQATELLDRLSPKDAIGGRHRRHHELRASLALHVERAADAMEAARALEPHHTGDAAVFRARAVLAGAPLDREALDPEDPSDALVLSMVKPDRLALTPELVERSESLPGWRAAMARAALWRALDDEERSAAELENAGGDDDPRASLAVARFRLDGPTSPDQVGDVAAAAARVAAEIMDGPTTLEFLELATAALLRGGQNPEAATLARDLNEKWPDQASPTGSQLMLRVAMAELEAGELEAALTASSQALEDLPEQLGTATAWTAARAAWHLCDMESLAAAQDALPDGEAGVVAGLVAACEGDIEAARGALDPAGLTPLAAVDVALAGALVWYDAPQARPLLQAAVKAADDSGVKTLRIGARMALERHARLSGQGAPRVLKELEGLGGPAMAMELYARKLSAGIPAEAPPPAEDEPDLLKAWRGFDGEPDPDAAGGPAAWALARHRLGAGDMVAATSPLGKAITSSPVHRQGRWAPPLALDGADGPDLEQDIAKARAHMEAGGAEPLLLLHEWHNFREMARLRARLGQDPLTAAPPEKARELRAAFGRERTQTWTWLAGHGPFPAEARDTARDAADGVFCRAGLDVVPSISAMRSTLPETALFSVRLGRDTGELLLVTPTTVHTTILDPKEIRSLAQRHREAMLRGHAFTGQDASSAHGDKLRRRLLDPHLQYLGVGKYLLVAPPDLLVVPWFTLPEQEEGRRYLADIRTTGALPYLGLALGPKRPEVDGYTPDFFGVGPGEEERPAVTEATAEDDMDGPVDEVEQAMKAAGLKSPDELDSAARLFGAEFSIVRHGDDATTEEFLSNAPKARYVHLTRVDATPDGGLQWADGATSLSRLRCMESRAQLVVLSSATTPEAQLARAETLLRSGATHTLAAMWDLPSAVRTRYLMALYDALNRDRPPAMALSDARGILMSGAGRDDNHRDPSYWGTFLLVGAP